jgi:hypothetical protein
MSRGLAALEVRPETRERESRKLQGGGGDELLGLLEAGLVVYLRRGGDKETQERVSTAQERTLPPVPSLLLGKM